MSSGGKRGSAILWLGLPICLFLLAACGSTEGAASERALLASLPPYPGAVLVQEYDYEVDGVETFVRGYVTAQPLEQAVDTVTGFYREWLAQRGWELVQPFSASYSAFRKDGDEIVLGRAGPEVTDAPPGANVTRLEAVPAEVGLYFLLEVSRPGPRDR